MSHSSEQREGHNRPLDVLIIGEITQEVSYHLSTSKKCLASAASFQKLRCEWTKAQVRIGGFAAHAARCVRKSGDTPYLCTLLTSPLSPAIERFIAEVAVDTTHVRATPGISPASLDLEFEDGHLLISRSGALSDFSPPIPNDAVDRFDLILVGPQEQGESILRKLRSVEGKRGKAVIACCAHPEMTRQDLHVVAETCDWFFVDSADAANIASRQESEPLSETRAIHEIKRILGAVRLVVTRGADGALLLNGDPTLHEIPASPLSNGSWVGGRDTICATLC